MLSHYSICLILGPNTEVLTQAKKVFTLPLKIPEVWFEKDVTFYVQFFSSAIFGLHFDFCHPTSALPRGTTPFLQTGKRGTIHVETERKALEGWAGSPCASPHPVACSLSGPLGRLPPAALPSRFETAEGLHALAPVGHLTSTLISEVVCSTYF